MKIRPVGTELFHAEGQRDGHDEANSRVRNFTNMLKNCAQSQRFIGRKTLASGLPCRIWYK
jgi:hypothetical protein